MDRISGPHLRVVVERRGAQRGGVVHARGVRTRSEGREQARREVARHAGHDGAERAARTRHVSTQLDFFFQMKQRARIARPTAVTKSLS